MRKEGCVIYLYFLKPSKAIVLVFVTAVVSAQFSLPSEVCGGGLED